MVFANPLQGIYFTLSFFVQGKFMSESSLKTIHGMTLVQGALLQAFVWKEMRKTDLAQEFSQQYVALLQKLKKETPPDTELIAAVETAHKTTIAQLPLWE